MTEKLVKTAIEKRSKDNVSAIVLQLGSYRTAWSEFVNKLENHITPEIIQREFEVSAFYQCFMN
jgi:serine/threonine protein phosphatase PrpC